MIFSRFMKILARGITLLALSLVLTATAAEPPLIKPLSNTDQQYLSTQHSSLEELSRTKLGRQFRDEKDADLALLQLLLDRQVVRGDQKRELQAMGVIMGNLLAQELNMHWVIYEDAAGRSRALRYKDSDHYLFPMTMISRRREVDNDTSVQDIYQRAVSVIQPILPSVPYQ